MKQGPESLPEPSLRGWILCVGVALFLVYLPSLEGGWVWDDHYLIGAQGALRDFEALFLRDVWSPATGQASDIYRPLTMASHALLQMLWPGPLSERIFNLLLHGGATLAAGAVARRLGAAPWVALLCALGFGLHPAVSENVAWISGRDDLLPGAGLLVAWALFVGGRSLPAGLLLALLPFCKETYLLVPAVAGCWMLGRRRLDWALAIPTTLGVVAYLGIRRLLDLPLPERALTEPVAALGAMTRRGVRLFLDPTAPDALPIYQGSAALGILGILLGAALITLAWGRPRLAGLAGALLLLIPGALAAAHLGLVGDRYFYVAVAAAWVALSGLPLGRLPLAARWGVCALPLLLGAFTAQRAGAWTDEGALFGASLRADPSNPYAAFHVAHHLHTDLGDCARAIPLYGRALDVEPRAGTNLQACLIAEGDLEAALALGPRVTGASPMNPNPALNTARAAVALGRLDAALPWAEEALKRDPTRSSTWVYLGNLQGMRGDVDAAEAAFRGALALSPEDPGARQGMAAVEAARQLLASPPAPGPPSEASPPAPAPPSDASPPTP